jgi:hypothetical protein
MKTLLGCLLAGLIFIGANPAASAQTNVVGTVTVCYYSPDCTYANIPDLPHAPNEALRDLGEHPKSRLNPTSVTPVDAPAFEFTNTGTEAITGASFEIMANKKLGIVHDTFSIGKIESGASVVVVPGASNDKKTHPSGSFFSYTGSALDTSDSGPSSSAIVFEFNGHVGDKPVTSGDIITGKSAGPSTDGTVAKINFLGGPGNADAPCDNCVAPKVIANITTEAAAEPSTDEGK